MSYLFTSESVTEGHPDKVCDQVSDAIVDAALREDPHARVACECMASEDLFVITGEMRLGTQLDFERITRQKIQDIGYSEKGIGFDHECDLRVKVKKQSPDIALGVDSDRRHHKEQGAGDQGMMVGYACIETPELMPLPIMLAHRFGRKLAEVRKSGLLSYLRPDGKSQVTVEYTRRGEIPRHLHAVVISAHHVEGVSLEQIQADIRRHVIETICREYAVFDGRSLFDEHTVIHVNPTGRFVHGGPKADAGLTGRKIIVDTYGTSAPHGGGAFSGKDPSKVDRSGAYAARWVAKNIVKAGLAKKCEIHIAYVIGRAEPVSVYVDTKGTSVKGVTDEMLERTVREVFDLRPAVIIRDLQLLKPQYQKLATYGHMGREELGVKWEEVNRISELLEAIEKVKK